MKIKFNKINKVLLTFSVLISCLSYSKTEREIHCSSADQSFNFKALLEEGREKNNELKWKGLAEGSGDNFVFIFKRGERASFSASTSIGVEPISNFEIRTVGSDDGEITKLGGVVIHTRKREVNGEFVEIRNVKSIECVSGI